MAYCLICRAQLGGYFYAYYLLTLLLHRAYCDDAKYREKYSKLWKEYRDRVPYVLLLLNILDAPLRAAGKALYWLTNSSEALKQE